MRMASVVLAFLGCLACVSCSRAQPSAEPSAKSGVEVTTWESQTPMDKPLAGEKGRVLEVTVVVEKIDMVKRLITVKRPDNSVVTVKAGPEVKRLAEIKPGDSVVMKYVQAVAYEVRPVTKSERKEPLKGGVVAERNEPELPPGVGVVGAIQSIVTITAIDKKAATVTIKQSTGESSVIPVKRPENLDRIKVGDTAAITYMEAVALEIEPAKKIR